MSVLSMSEVPFEQDRTALAKPGEPGAALSTALTRSQWRFIVLLMLSVNINFLDRGSLAAAAPAIASELFLSPTKLGVLLSAFSWTYPPFLLIAGWAVDRYSVKWVFAAGFLLWSLATLASGLTHSFNMLLALRLLLGIGESVAYPAYSKLVASGFREQARGFVNSLLDTGSKIGPGLAILIGGLMVARFGWRALFWTMGAASLLWLIPWIIWAPSDAGRHTNRQGAKVVRRIMTRRDAWGTFLGHFCANYSVYFLMTWLPAYLVMQRHYSMKLMAIWGSIPFMGSAVTSLAGGWLSDRWIASGGRPTFVRKGFVATGLLFASVMLPAPLLHNRAAEMTLLVVSLLAFGLFGSNVWALTQTLAGPEIVGTWAGIQTCIAALAGIFAPLITGVIVTKTGSFFLAFLVSALMLVVGAVSYFFIVTPDDALTRQHN